jgi:hypothetical protein
MIAASGFKIDQLQINSLNTSNDFIFSVAVLGGNENMFSLYRLVISVMICLIITEFGNQMNSVTLCTQIIV